jgi:hypothetical protein
MPAIVSSSRGTYRLAIGDRTADRDGSLSFTATLERADGIERVAFRCRIDRSLAGVLPNKPNAIEERLGKWLAREFEQTREAALKSIRAERRPLEIAFDECHPGPFG